MTDICPIPKEMGGGCGGLGTPNGLARSYNNVILAPFPREMYSGEKIPVQPATSPRVAPAARLCSTQRPCPPYILMELRTKGMNST